MTSRENLASASDGGSLDGFDDDPELKTKFDRSSCCNPFSNIHRFVVFVFICFLSFGNYFCYDTPASLQLPLVRDLGISNQQYGLLYSVYSWPNVFLSFLGGYTIDGYLGIRWGAIIFATFIAAGQVTRLYVFYTLIVAEFCRDEGEGAGFAETLNFPIQRTPIKLTVAAGAYMNLFTLMVIGRFIFAIGGESLAVAQNTYTVKWFKGKELNTVFGIQLSFARIGSTVTQATMLLIYTWMSENYFSGHKALGVSLFIAFLTTLISLSCGFILWYFDKRRDKFLALRQMYDQQKYVAVENSNLANSSVGSSDFDDKAPFSPRDILRFPPTMWLLCCICVTFYACIFPLVSFGQLFYVNKFKLSPYTASICNGMIYFTAIPASIIGGMIVDHFGRNVLFIIISILVALIGHGLLALTFLTPFVATIILGCSYSLLASSLWPCVAYVVPGKALGSAYGVMQSIQNLGLAVLFLLIGVVVDNLGYLVLELVFVTLLCLALALAILLYFVDGAYGGLLTMDGRMRKIKLKPQ